MLTKLYSLLRLLIASAREKKQRLGRAHAFKDTHRFSITNIISFSWL